MARVTHVKHAKKDYPYQGIVKGQEYWWTKHAFGPKLFFTKPPKPSQLTQSEFLSQAYDLEEQVELLDAKDFETLEDLKDEVSRIVDDIRSLGEEQQEHHDNMPEGLQEGDTGQLLEQRADAMEEWASSLESAAGDLDEEEDEEEDEDGAKRTLLGRIAAAIETVQGDSSPDIA